MMKYCKIYLQETDNTLVENPSELDINDHNKELYDLFVKLTKGLFILLLFLKDNSFEPDHVASNFKLKPLDILKTKKLESLLFDCNKIIYDIEKISQNNKPSVTSIPKKTNKPFSY